MTTGEEQPPTFLVSTVDPDYECVPVDPEAAEAVPPAGLDSRYDADPPTPLCPLGYVPRRRERSSYDLDGKVIMTSETPEENPKPPPAH